MTKTINFQALGSSAIDKEAGIIRGVSVITEGEAKGHGVKIDAQTLLEVKASAESFPGGVRVKVNHGSGFENIVGKLDDFRIEGNQLRADLALLKSHALFQTILELASNYPDIFGLSISFSGVTEEKGDELFARCDELYSVDLVDRPAANPSGLFSIPSVDSRIDGMAEDNKTLLESIKSFVGLTHELSAPKISELQTKLTASETALTASLKTIEELSAKNKENAAKNSELSAKITELDAKITKHASELEAKGTEIANKVLAGLGVAPLSGSASGAKDFAALVADHALTAKVSKGQAVSDCISKFPTEYAAWKASGKTATL